MTDQNSITYNTSTKEVHAVITDVTRAQMILLFDNELDLLRGFVRREPDGRGRYRFKLQHEWQGKLLEEFLLRAGAVRGDWCLN